MLGKSGPRQHLVRPEKRELAFPFNRGSLGESSSANMCLVLLTACPNGHACSVGEVSLGIQGRVWGVQNVCSSRSEEGSCGGGGWIMRVWTFWENIDSSCRLF